MDGLTFFKPVDGYCDRQAPLEVCKQTLFGGLPRESDI
ncbi:hypothetical protein AF72_11980 [Xylella taiwanensis]|uniref:Uncharacterized protein n=1 Tax=Xylella taiwanensis TaxID=1444770 RepID=Z9JGS8_9GAMM|nr:hypothetical protein AF72_11980 [Xylella taiwanensis]